MSVTVDAGPAGTGYNVNRLYTTVKVCHPGSTQCQTIDHVLVDTGSTGLRLLASVLSSDWQAASGGLPLLNCVQFVDNTVAWGPVATADVVLGGKTATNVPIQVIGDPAFNSLATATSCSGTAMTTAKDIGANGVLGIGLLTEDCGAPCADSPYNGSYYTCTDASCTAAKGVEAGLAQQVKHPVSMFTADNNGVSIELPAVMAVGSPSLSGSLIFGIGTRSNNQLAAGTGTVLTTNSSGYITTWLGAQSLPHSFIDSGSNGLFFDSITIANCGSSAPGFYCATSRTTLSATLVGVNGVPSPVLSFPIGNATDLFASGTNSVLPTLAGDLPGQPSTFDWGLPFFYGRRVFFGIEGKESTLGTATVTGPFYAF